MIIEYEKNKHTTETFKFEIEDIKNVFLQGNNMWDNVNSYFGIWESNNRVTVVTITGYKTINYDYCFDTGFSTICYIKEYLGKNNNVKIISKEEFKEQIDHIRKRLEI